MYLKKSNPKTDLHHLIRLVLKEFNVGVDDLIDSNSINQIKQVVKLYYDSIHNINKVKFNFDFEFIKIIKANRPIKEPEYDELDIINLREQINFLKSIPTQEQRSLEWYKFRQENITASSIGDICIKSELSYYNAVLKKCKADFNFKQLTNNAIMHGVKYEQVAIDVYQNRNCIQVLEFGCVPHKYIPHLAASPDGIVDYCEENPNYVGRMLEIKCPYSRQITGIIPEGYYYQIQVQLEVCDLNYCDFLECKIVDFDSYQEMEEYKSKIKNHSFNENEFGCILEWKKNYNSNIEYRYSPIGLDEDTLEDWISSQIDEFNEIDTNFIISKYNYWVLEYSSVVLVKRDRSFFEKIKPKILQFWNDVEYFRKNTDELNQLISSLSKNNTEYELEPIIDNNKNNNNTNNNIKKECMISSSDDDEPIVKLKTVKKVKTNPKQINNTKTNDKNKKTFTNTYNKCVIDSD